MRLVLPFIALSLAPGCYELMGDKQAAADIARLDAQDAAASVRMDALEDRLAALEAGSTVPVAEPAPVGTAAPAPRPSPRPLVVPAVPVPPPTPVVPTGPVGKVQISSARDGLKITIDDVERSEVTPALILLPPGRHTVKVEGYDKQEIRVIEHETVMVVPH